VYQRLYLSSGYHSIGDVICLPLSLTQKVKANDSHRRGKIKIIHVTRVKWLSGPLIRNVGSHHEHTDAHIACRVSRSRDYTEIPLPIFNSYRLCLTSMQFLWRLWRPEPKYSYFIVLHGNNKKIGGINHITDFCCQFVVGQAKKKDQVPYKWPQLDNKQNRRSKLCNLRSKKEALPK